MFDISAQNAAKELLARREAREDLLKYTKYTMSGFEAGKHHKKICEALEKVERGECKRLMIFAPPRHTKSELASRRFPAWYLGRNKKRQIISTTYSADFASDFGRDVRNNVQSAEHARIFPGHVVKQDSSSANRWHTKDGSVYVATGVGGSITGRGAHLAIIDDPFKNRQEADSQINRDNVWKWYTSTLYTRLMPDAAILLILTRWHEDDLAGRLLAEQERGGDKWEVLSLPAITNNEALWPEWYDLDYLKQTKRVVGERDWSALYQQDPRPSEGTFFKREWLKRYDFGQEPVTNKYQSTDFAVSKDGGDWTELGILGLDADRNIWVHELWSGQEEADTWVKEMLKQVKRHKTLCSFGEKGVIRKAVEPLIRMLSKEMRIYPRIEWIARTADKVAMAHSLQGMASMGKLYIPKCEWGDELIEQLVAFPVAKHDDKVDMLSLFALAVNDTHPAILDREPETERPTDAWGRYNKNDEEGWR